MNRISHSAKKEIHQKLRDAFALGLPRRKACKHAGLSHTTFYRWLQKDKAFNKFVIALELRHADQHAWYRWRTHPFRGRRPPRRSNLAGPYPTPRFEVLPSWFYRA